ncbi:hypothetical protein AU198_20800 [Mycobacterium sp. GA-1199]|uniref:restriction endonuclease subunit S n=1 Tax=Mycobacterium sp. GA-1199 TaxID=1772287 RepID=UPI000748850A|nr:restriction endonuclease subunit S [Mycobacterium sp. GA-1199]KUI48413.1 hypothetical protein AU198_20800 [Mycobacterium sp. GA-1199]
MNWPTVVLGELSDTAGQYGVGLSSRYWRDGDPRYIRITDIQDDGRLNSEAVAPDGDRRDWEKAILKEGDLLFARSGATVGKTYLHPAGAPLAVYAGYLIRFKLDTDRVFPPYVFRYTQSPAYRTWVSSAQRAVAQPNINAKQYAALPIPLPPLDEQRRIAAVLDQADGVVRKQRSVLGELDVLTQAVFQDMFGDPTTWPMRWTMGHIGDMAESVQYGTSSKAGDAGDWPIVRMGNVTDNGQLDLADLKWIDLADSDVPRYTLRRGDLLFNRTNSKEKVGKTCVVATDRPLAYAGYLVRVRLKPQHRPEFVNAFMTSRYGQALRRGMAKAAVNQANINAAEMRSIPIALPPTEMQISFAEAVERIGAERLRQLAAIEHGRGLSRALSLRAFSGQL